MTILLLGSQGYLGQELIPRLASLCEVYEHDRFLNESSANLEFIREKNVNLIINCTNMGVSGPEVSQDQLETNIFLPLRMVNDLANAKLSVPFVHVSTREAIGRTFGPNDVVVDDRQRHYPKRAFGEDCENLPSNLFGWMKLAAEKAVLQYSHGLVGRLSTPYTDILYQDRGGLISKIGSKALTENLVSLTSGGNQLRDPLHVSDFASFLTSVYKSKDFAPGLFHLGGGLENWLSLKEIALAINPNCEIVDAGRGDLGFVFNIEKAKQMYQWSPTVNFKRNAVNFRLN